MDGSGVGIILDDIGGYLLFADYGISAQDFSLTGTYQNSMNGFEYYSGTLSIGNTDGIVINGSFINLELADLGGGMLDFNADITFTGISTGADMTDWSLGTGLTSEWLVTGRLEGGYFMNSLSAELGSLDIQPVPVPAAVWLFGSGLLGLAGIARRKSA